ncbi:MAG TPA: TIGR03936 family radical SAM-associated protein [Jatrophihabitans sp.]|nr:TIGR03936 family radical SAM-associated protein [Jatrophihabitans sp.]
MSAGQARGSRRSPDAVHVAPVQRIRLRYAKRGRLRFTSHRDFARAFERSLRRADVPMAYSAGFHPHPRISYVGAAPTGVASEAEYLEIALAEHRDPAELAAVLDAALPAGLDIVQAVDAADCPPGSLADAIQASEWQLELAADPGQLQDAVTAFLREEVVLVERLTKDGRREIDARGPVLAARVAPAVSGAAAPAVSGAVAPAASGAVAPAASGRPAVSAAGSADPRAILTVVVRQVTPTVRPDDVLAALRLVAGFAPSEPARATRLAQGPVDEAASVADPLRKTGLSTR